MKEHILSWTGLGKNTQNSYTYTHAHMSDVFQLPQFMRIKHHTQLDLVLQLSLWLLLILLPLHNHTQTAASLFFSVHKTTSVLSEVNILFIYIVLNYATYVKLFYRTY